MAREYSTVDEYLMDLNAAIDDVMQTEIAENAIKELQKVAENKVYKYPPLFHSRREKRGGLTDPANMPIDYDYATKTLTVGNDTEWQNVGFIKKDGSGTKGNKLIDVIQERKVYNAPARPFVEWAEIDYRVKHFERDLINTLKKIGF